MAAIIQASKLADLLREADLLGPMYVTVTGMDRLALGIDPMRPSLLVDISRERVIPYKDDSNARKIKGIPEVTGAQTATRRMHRRSGSYWFELDGRRIECGSLKELLARGLRHLEHSRPGMLERLSAVKARSRRIVAHDPHQLFDKEHLARDYAEKLMDGWWYGTNNSAQQTHIWLRRACDVSGVSWEKAFKSSLATNLEAAVEL